MTGFALGIASALCWSALDAVRKMVVTKASPTSLVVFLLVGQVPFLGLWALWDGVWIRDPGYWPFALGSMGMNALANVLFMRSVQLSPLSRTVPFLSLTPVFSALAAMPLLGEVPGPMHGSGIALVVLGALLLNSDLSDSWWRSLSLEKGGPYMIAVAALWAFSTALDKRALPHASPASHAFVLTVGSAVVLVSWVLARRTGHELRAVLRVPKGQLVSMLAFAVAAVALQLLALQTLWVAVLETLKRAIGVLGSILLGRAIFVEPITPRKLMAAMLMIAGTALLAVA